MKRPDSIRSFLLVTVGVALVVSAVAHVFLHAAVGVHDMIVVVFVLSGVACVLIGLGAGGDAARLLQSWRKGGG